MKLSDIKKNFVFTTKITLDEGTGDFIELREPTQGEIFGLGGEENEVLKKLESLLPECIIDSSFVDDAGEKASGKAIYDELSASGSLLSDVLNIWLEAIPFQHRLKKN